MFELAVRDMSGQQVGTYTVEDTAFGPCVRHRLLHQVVVGYQANCRQGTHMTRTRSMVSGSNKKPWRQKGTGFARAGTRKSPLWRGGGIMHGPVPRSYRKKLPKKMRRVALASAMLAKLRDQEVVLLKSFDLPGPAPKTKVAASTLKALGVEGSCLVGIADNDPLVYKSFRNIDRTRVLPVGEFNALEVLLHKTIVLTLDGVKKLVEASRTGLKPAAAGQAKGQPQQGTDTATATGGAS